MVETKDVKEGQDSSADQTGVKVDSPPTNDVNASDSSTEGADKKHEDPVPYERLKESRDQVADLKAQLEEREREIAGLTDKEPEIDPFEGIKPDKEGQSTDTGQLSQNLAEIESKFKDDMWDKPLQTIGPFVQQLINQSEKNKATVRGIPGFKDYEEEYYNVPDDVVIQAQNNPNLIKFLLAKHSKTLKPTRSSQTQEKKPSDEKPPEKSDQITNMDEYKEKLRKEGETRIIEQIRKGEGLMAEGAGGGQDAGGGGDEPELDEAGKQFMAKFGVSDTKSVAKRLDTLIKTGQIK